MPFFAESACGVGRGCLGLAEFHLQGSVADLLFEVVGQFAEIDESVAELDVLQEIVGEEAVTLLLEALGGLVALCGGEYHYVAAGECTFFGFNFYATHTFVDAFVVAVDTAEAGVEEDGGLVESQVTYAAVELVEGDAVLGFGAAHVGGQDVCLVFHFGVGHTMSGIVDDEFLLFAILDTLQPSHFVFHDELLGGVFNDVDIGSGDTDGLLAIFAEYAGIVDGIGNFGHETVVLVADDEGVGVVPEYEVVGDEAIDFGCDIVIVHVVATAFAVVVAIDNVFG